MVWEQPHSFSKFTKTLYVPGSVLNIKDTKISSACFQGAHIQRMQHHSLLFSHLSFVLCMSSSKHTGLPTIPAILSPHRPSPPMG